MNALANASGSAVVNPSMPYGKGFLSQLFEIIDWMNPISLFSLISLVSWAGIRVVPQLCSIPRRIWNWATSDYDGKDSIGGVALILFVLLILWNSKH